MFIITRISSLRMKKQQDSLLQPMKRTYFRRKKQLDLSSLSIKPTLFMWKKTARTIVTLYGTNIAPDYKATTFDNTMIKQTFLRVKKQKDSLLQPMKRT